MYQGVLRHVKGLGSGQGTNRSYRIQRSLGTKGLGSGQGTNRPYRMQRSLGTKGLGSGQGTNRPYRIQRSLGTKEFTIRQWPRNKQAIRAWVRKSLPFCSVITNHSAMSLPIFLGGCGIVYRNSKAPTTTVAGINNQQPIQNYRLELCLDLDIGEVLSAGLYSSYLGDKQIVMSGDQKPICFFI